MVLTHPFTTDDICQPAEQKLSYKRTNWCCNFDPKILVRVQFLAYMADYQSVWVVNKK